MTPLPPKRPLQGPGNDASGEPLCPFGDGRHKRLRWARDQRSGEVCVRCSKTWEWTDGALVATYDLLRARHPEAFAAPSD